MAEEYRDSIYWGSGPDGRWYKTGIRQQLEYDTRWKGSLMAFVRHAVRYTLENDKTLRRPRPENSKRDSLRV